MKAEVIEQAREYYNSFDADEFYFKVWGGEDIHVGIYEENDSIRDASRRTVEKMASLLPNLNSSMEVLDAGAGYGGAARYLVKEFGCNVTCLNLSEIQNERNRTMNEKEGLAKKIKVIDGSFENIPALGQTYDVVWSEDAFLHSPDKARVIAECARVLKIGGVLIFTDPMQSKHATKKALANVLKRIHLDSMGSFDLYEELAKANGMEHLKSFDLSYHLVTHYSRVKNELEHHEEAQVESSREYVANMIRGLDNWIEAGSKGQLNWGILLFQKIAQKR